MNFSKAFYRVQWISLALIYLVVIAGSVVRTTGSGMGCPDWPKCFGQWVPPTEASQLPEGYQEVLAEKRIKKAEKFSNYLRVCGFEETADQLKNDIYLTVEQPFNASRTWTEYANRLVGFLAGNVVLLIFIWAFIRYRKQRRILILTFVNLILMGFQGWFGSIVVASNLVPWTITVHLLIALVIIAVQIYLIFKIKGGVPNLALSKPLKWVLIACGLITFSQMFLGTQVRESIDELTRAGIGREEWSSQMGLMYFVHRSFSWLVLAFLLLMAIHNERNEKHFIIRLSFILLSIELFTGLLLAHFDLRGWVPVAHLLFASLIFGVLWMAVLRSKIKS
jgi:cytochrome c oxidase assembly protein subunit 15